MTGTLTRRDFLKAGGAAAGGLTVAFLVPAASRAAQAVEPAAPFAPNAFLRIGSDDRITVLLSHSEMGQGIWTTLPMLIAEELDADWSRVRAEHAPAAPAYAHAVFGMQMTGGSSSTWSEFDRYRQAGALARALLIQAAAQRFGVDPSQCRTDNGVVHAGDRKATYGELAVAASRLPAPGPIPLKDPRDWKIIGQPRRRLDGPEKVNGRAIFGMDVQFPGLLTALVARPPVFGAKVRSFDAARAKAVPGVRAVLQVPSGVAVVAEDFWAAERGRDALAVAWDLGPNAGLDTGSLFQEFRRLAATPGKVAAQAGDAPSVLAKASKVLEAEYAVPYLAHAPMEPLNCTVKLGPDSCEIWSGTQFQGPDHQAAARITGLKPSQITLHTVFLGGGFGRRANPTSDFVTEALHVAKAAGRPVKVVWTREDDIRGGYYRSGFLHRARVALGADGLPEAWQHTLVGQSILVGTPFEAMMMKNGIDPTSTEGVADSPYLAGVPHHHVSLHSPSTGVPVLWWRSVGHSHTAFVMESLIDELAHAAGVDPLAYRRRLLQAHPRHLAVLELAAEKAGWGRPVAAGHALGLAVHESFGSFVAQVAEVSVDQGRPRVHRVVCAVDCGLAVNPEGVRAQMEGAVVFGLTAALHGEITFAQGRVRQGNFHDYPLLRINEMPRVEVHILPSTAKMGGIGEPGVPPVAPAVANALFLLTGQRVRHLPIRL
ncbi:xanthine dehydrogenase family protein molybdopterin-binding subunit [Geothrix sp. 21YS21S-2]|uniref:xanthine dehydrogenase family protein molybdopterin-binding subunit n=1 Tax=Geothrix sp. 21YS21S-2 TaxID=3068893 RepID=UPI0027BA85D0|nr:xanthine dehydrogenase family protein molybdopterin-binding subunit [Geothrix sp. 21YS21S-2]